VDNPPRTLTTGLGAAPLGLGVFCGIISYKPVAPLALGRTEQRREGMKRRRRWVG